MPTATKRQRKKEARRRGQSIPGYERGGTIPAFDEGGEDILGIGDGGGGGWANIGDRIRGAFDSITGTIINAQALNNLPPGLRAFIEALNGVNSSLGPGVEPIGVGDLLDILDASTPSGGGGGGGGGGLSLSVSDIGPVREAIERLNSQIAVRGQDIQLQIAQLTDERETALGNRRLEIDQQLADLKAQQVELAKLQQQIDQQVSLRQQDINLFGLQIQQRGQDIQQQQSQFQSEIDIWAKQLDNALARGDLELAQEAQANLDRLNQAQLALTGRGQDITQRQQDIDIQLQQNQDALTNAQSLRQFAIDNGQLQLQTGAEARIRQIEAANLGLQAQQAQLESATFEQQGAQGAANVFSNIARDLGQQELQRDQMLAQLLANPRDYAQLQIALGNGKDFFSSLLQGQPTAQTVGNIGDVPLLGETFNATLDQINQRPELDYFDQAAQFADLLGNMQAPETFDPQAFMDMILSQMPEMPDFSELQPAPFTPMPVDVPPVAPIEMPDLLPISTGTPLPMTDYDVARQIRDEAFANAEATGQNMSAADLWALLQNAPSVEPPAPPTQVPSVVPNVSPSNTPGTIGTQPGATGYGPNASVYYNTYVDQGMTPEAARQQTDAVLQAFGKPPTFAGGGQLMIDEPTVAVGMESGEPKFTLGERTPEYPAGIPERVDITPIDKLPGFQGGGTVALPRTLQLLKDKYGPNAGYTPGVPSNVNRNRSRPRQITPGTPSTQPVKPRPTYTQPRQGSNYNIGDHGPDDELRAIVQRLALDRLLLQQIRSGGPFRGFGSTQPVMQRPTIQPVRPAPRPYVPPQLQDPANVQRIFQRFIGQGNPLSSWFSFVNNPGNFMPTTQGFDEGGTVMNPGQILLGLRNNLLPRQYVNMLPSTRGVTDSRISALGLPPEDFWADWSRGIPTGPNPASIFRANFADGGTVLVA